MQRDAGWDAIDAASTEWVAAQDAPCRQPRAANDTVRADRLLRVVAAARIEAALATEHARERRPVQTDEADRDRPRAGRPLAIRPCGRSSPLTSAHEFGHLTHQILALRADDRRPRHQDRVAIRDRLGDLSPRRPEHAPRSVSLHRPAHTLARDHRDPIGSGDEEQYDPFSADRPCRVEDLPDVARAHLSTFPQVRRSNERGPCGVSPRGSNGPRACAFGDGSRAPSHGGGCSVGTYACLWPWMMNLTRCDGRRGRRRHEYTGIIAG